MVNPVCNRVSRSVNLSRLGKLLLSLEQSYVATGHKTRGQGRQDSVDVGGLASPSLPANFVYCGVHG